MLITIVPWIWYTVYTCPCGHRYTYIYTHICTHTLTHYSWINKYWRHISRVFLRTLYHTAWTFYSLRASSCWSQLPTLASCLKKHIKGLQMSSKTCFFYLIMYVIFSIVMFNAISLIHLPILGPSTFFQLREMVRLACNIHISTNLDSLLCSCGIVGYVPRIKSLGSSGSFLSNIWTIIFKIPCQKDFTFTHSHMQWYTVPLASLHLIHVSGMLSLNLVQFVWGYVCSHQPFILNKFQVAVNCLFLSFHTCPFPVL